ncbi:TonB-dependent receptor [Flavobacterium sp. F-65]|jgi:outer membrane receptor protein involved in Fe transport|uniref:TonB-dependent receptor n=1 Tax=Flavobacterium pisciphilum TaxID=2893755 RepID=A0ABS8MP43_9FLAO|nr:TonB-dependent receptor [Flavobacterium sp. F-65]MCC9070529.1 TonB-dependent receptor [Flavobacterium sp. F-65]
MKYKIRTRIAILILLFFSILTNVQINAQTSTKTSTQTNVSFKGTISGKVVNEKSEPMPYANVAVLDSNRKFLIAGITEANGTFEMQAPLQNIIVEVSYNDYSTFSKKLTLDNANKKAHLGEIKLQANINILNEVVVAGQKSTLSYKRDKKVFTVGKDILAQSNSALEILENIPSVTVDASGQVSLRGSSNVTVLIDGRRSGLTLNNALDQIPAINIDRVEIITNPSARYEATGSAGILNIILKKNKKDGVNGQLTLRYGVPIDSRIGSSINYKTNKFNFFATVGERYTDYKGKYSSNQVSDELGPNRNLYQFEKENRHDDGALFYGGFDYYFTDKESITLAYNINVTKDKDKSALGYNYNTGNVADSIFNRNTKSLENRSYNQIELNYLKNFDKKGRKFTIDFQYDFWDSTKDWNISTQKTIPDVENPMQLRTNNQNGNKDYVLQTDYVTPVKEKGNLEFGLKGEHRNVTNKYLAENLISDQWEVFKGLDNDLDYKETIGAAYIQYGSEWGKFNYQLGLRDEYTSVKIEDDKQEFTKSIDYNRLFPTVHLGYAFSEKAGLQLSYSKRINRPSIWDLNPFNEIKDFTYQLAGNPDLNPEYVDAYEFGANKNFEKVYLSSSIYYHRTKDVMQYYVYQDGENSFVTVPVNLDSEDKYGLEATLNYNPIKRISLYSSFNIYKFSQKGIYEGQDFDFSSQYWQFQIRAQVKLPKDLNFQGFWSYSGKIQNAQTTTAAIYYLNLSVNKSFLSNKLTVGVNAINVLDTRKEKVTTINDSYTINRISNRNGRQFTLSLLYRFAEKQFKERQIKESNRN